MNITNERLLEMRNTFALCLPRRADGGITPPVVDAELVSALDELAELRAYKERTEALIDRALLLAATGAKPPQAEGQAEPMLTINAEVRRRMRSVLAILTAPRVPKCPACNDQGAVWAQDHLGVFCARRCQKCNPEKETT